MNPNDPTPRKRGRPAGPPELRRDHPAVVNLTENEHARAKSWAVGQGAPLGEAIRRVLLPLIGAALVALAGCSPASMLAVKPALATGCAVARASCALIERGCVLVEGAGGSSGGEAPAPDAGSE